MSLGLLMACFLAATQAVSFWTTKRLLTSQIREREIDNIRILSGFLQNLLTEQARRISTIAQLAAESQHLPGLLADGQPPDRAAVAAAIKVLADRAQTDLIQITDRHETVLYQADAPNSPPHPSPLWGVSEALAGRSTQTSHATRTEVAIYAVEPLRLGKEIVGTLAVGMPFDAKFVRQLSQEVHAGVALLQRSGGVVATAGITNAIDHTAVDEAFLEKIPIYRLDEAGHQTYAYLPLLIVDEAFVVLVQIDSSQAYHMLHQGLRLSGFSALAIFITSGILGIAVIQCTLRPLRRLRTYAERIAAKYLSGPIRAHYTDEIMASVQVISRLTQRILVKNRELRRLNDKLVVQDHTKSEFVSSVSHELRTPLTSILGFAKIIRRDLLKVVSGQFTSLPATKQEKMTQRLVSNLDIITDESGRLTTMINDILDLAKIESGTVQWQDRPVSPAELIQKTADAARGLIAAKPDVCFVTDVAADLPVLCIDADRIRQVLLNLLANAFKFTPHGSVSLDAIRVEQAVRFHVADSGIGIPPEEMQRIFDRFYQASTNAALAIPPRGTGLGLSITRSILAHYKSAIQVAAREGGGSVFWFDIAIAPPATAAAATPA